MYEARAVRGSKSVSSTVSYIIALVRTVLVYHILECCIIVLWFIRAPFYVLLVFVTVCSPT